MITDKIIHSAKRKKYFDALVKNQNVAVWNIKTERKRKRLLPSTEIWPTLPGYFVSPEGDEKSISLKEFRKIQLKKGDRVYFERGQIYNFAEYTVLVDNITFSSYGAGADPILRGSDDIGGLTWTSEGSNRFSCPYSTPIKWVGVNGVAAKLAETPWYKITSQPSGTNIRATSLISAWGSSVAGAGVLVREYYFTYSTYKSCTAYDNSTGQVTLSSAILTGRTEFAFKLFNQLQFMTEEFEFFHDTSANKIYYQTAGSSPWGTDIRVWTEDFAIELDDNVSGFTCDGIEFREYYNSAIQGFTNPSFTLRNCNINNIRNNGIFLWGPTTGVLIEDNTFSKCGQNGMLLGGLINPTISGNTLTTMGRERTPPIMQIVGGTLSTWEQTQGCAIVFTYDLTNTSTFAVDGGTVTENIVSDCAYCGINFTGTLTTVSYNEVDEVMLDLEDGAGIYCVSNPQAPYGTQVTGTVITKNIVKNVRGKYDHCPLVHPTMNSWGIYVDYQCDSVVITNNSVYCMDAGGLMKINYGCRNNTITGNTLIGSVYGVLFGNYDSIYINNVGNVFTGNTIATSTYPVTTYDVDGGTTYNPFSGGSTNNNFYINPYGDVVGRRLEGTPALSYTLAAWRTFTGGDAGSVISPIAAIAFTGYFSALQEIITEINYTASSVSFPVPTGFVDKSGITAGNNVTIPAHEGVAFIKTSSVAVVYDTFTGTNGTSISGRTPNVGGNWTLRHGTITISSNAMVASVTGNATQTIASSDANVMIQSSKGTTGNINLILRHDGTSGAATEDYIWIFWGSNLISLIEHTGPSTDVTLETCAQQLDSNTNFYLEAQVVGNRILIKVNNETKIDYTGLTLDPSSVIFGFRQPSTGGSISTTFAISLP